MVKAQMAMRQDKHESVNLARKLTHEQRKAKNVQKIKKDTKIETQACVFRLNHLKDKSNKKKVFKNAKDMMLTVTGPPKHTNSTTSLFIRILYF